MTQPREHVIVLHGLGLHPFWLWPMANSLRRAGYAVTNLGYPSTRKNISELARDHLLPVARQSAQTAAKLHFVGHSLGGLLIRALVAECGFQPTGRVVMLGTPNHGSPLADHLRSLWPYRRYFGPAGQELGTAPRDKPQNLPPASFDLGVIAGINHWLHFPTGFFMQRPNDGIVPLSSTKVEGMKDHLAFNVDHSLMVLDPRIMRQTRHFLEYGFFKKQDV